MPPPHGWRDLLRSTFHDVGREDIVGLYSREWRLAKERLTADDRERLEREPRRWKRWFKTVNSVLYGLAQRLAPARRVLFLVVLACWLMTLFSPSCQGHGGGSGDDEKDDGKGVSYRVDFDSGFLTISSVLMLFLLGMELVDKINYRDELELARELQATLVPRVLPAVPGFELGAHNEIANMVGGDIYDFVPLKDGRLAVLFGDASGHGMAAGLVMAVAHAAFRTQLDVDPSPEAVFGTLNRILCRTGGPRAFFGAVYLLIERDGTFAGCVAGHPPVLRVGWTGAVVERYGRGAYPLGIRVPLTWPVERGQLADREALVLYSDGVSETRDGNGTDFSDARVEGALVRYAALSPAERVAALARDVRAFRGGTAPEDDVSIAEIRFSA